MKRVILDHRALIIIVWRDAINNAVVRSVIDERAPLANQTCASCCAWRTTLSLRCGRLKCIYLNICPLSLTPSSRYRGRNRAQTKIDARCPWMPVNARDEGNCNGTEHIRTHDAGYQSSPRITREICISLYGLNLSIFEPLRFKILHIINPSDRLI